MISTHICKVPSKSSYYVVTDVDKSDSVLFPGHDKKGRKAFNVDMNTHVEKLCF